MLVGLPPGRFLVKTVDELGFEDVLDRLRRPVDIFMRRQQKLVGCHFVLRESVFGAQEARWLHINVVLGELGDLVLDQSH